ncbi:hypothetical protein GQ53DRAFT_285342 [Thozetella sp. PMI_491]|nr:hypothetical protein GQ53DRAFT_285342 [Thozetella sp. PMI_491]
MNASSLGWLFSLVSARRAPAQSLALRATQATFLVPFYLGKALYRSTSGRGSGGLQHIPPNELKLPCRLPLRLALALPCLLPDPTATFAGPCSL